MGILQGSGEIAVQVAGSTKSETKLQLAEAETGTGTPCVSETDGFGGEENGTGACVKARLSMRVSMLEESGAGRPHAGTCNWNPY